MIPTVKDSIMRKTRKVSETVKFGVVDEVYRVSKKKTKDHHEREPVEEGH